MSKNIRVLLLSELNNPHTVKWATNLSAQGISVHVFGFDELYREDYPKEVTLHSLGLPKIADDAKLKSKLVYLKAIPKIKKIIKDIRPDIVHAHYASSYGFTGALLNFHPFIISVWGSDVMAFPSNIVTKSIIKYNFSKADKVLATSKYLKEITQKYTTKEVGVIPFGVDTNIFTPSTTIKENNKIVFGTVKHLEPIYGHLLALELFSEIVKALPDYRLEYKIAGSGTMLPLLEARVAELNITDRVSFLGYLKQETVPDFYRSIDLALYLSERESFGVSLIESMACGVPVIASDIPGFSEVLFDGVTGLSVNRTEIDSIAKSVVALIKNEAELNRLKRTARKTILELFQSDRCVTSMIDVYRRLLA